jgi:hypothetical protein
MRILDIPLKSHSKPPKSMINGIVTAALASDKHHIVSATLYEKLCLPFSCPNLNNLDGF